MQKPRDLIRHIERALAKAEQHISKLPAEVCRLPGMSGQSTRHFLNRLCALEGIRYLEIGAWQGSTLCAALHRNNIEAVAIDNWSLFGGPRDECMENVDLYAQGSVVTFIEDDCFQIDPKPLGIFDVYLFDGPHSEEDHFHAITHYYDSLASTAVVIIDDWNWQRVRAGTFRALDALRAPVVFEHEIRLTDDDSHTSEEIARESWHNGMYVFVLDKTRRHRWWWPFGRARRVPQPA